MNLPVYPQYAPTRNPWVGSAPSHWKFLRADFTTISNKEQISDAAMEGIEVLHYSIPNVQEFGTAQVEDGNEIDSAKLRIKTAQLLISKLNPRKATVCIAVPDEKLLTVCSGEFVPIIPEGDLTLRYCYYTWISDKVTKLLSSRVQSVTRSHQRVSPEDIIKLPWAWPPIAEQQQIAAFLDWKTEQIDALIARKRELLEKLKEKRLAVITQAVTRGLNPAAPLRDSGIPWLGQVPEHWEVRRLKFAATCNDEALSETTDPDYEIAYVDISSVNLVNGITKLENLQFEEAPSRARRIVRDGDTIISTVRTYLKAIAAIENPPDNMIVSTGFAVVRPFGFMDSRLLGYAMQSTNFIESVVAHSSGVSYPAINPTSLICLSIAYPKDKDEQMQIAAFLNSETAKLDSLERKVVVALERLQEYRTALITAATTGKIDVRNVKISEPVA